MTVPSALDSVVHGHSPHSRRWSVSLQLRPQGALPIPELNVDLAIRALRPGNQVGPTPMSRSVWSGRDGDSHRKCPTCCSSETPSETPNIALGKPPQRRPFLGGVWCPCETAPHSATPLRSGLTATASQPRFVCTLMTSPTSRKSRKGSRSSCPRPT